MRYLITFTCYGNRLHGGESGSVDREHNLFGNRMIEPDSRWAAHERQVMTQAPFTLESSARELVLKAIQEVCSHRNWILLAAYVRSSHVHVIVESNAPPERVMNSFKSYASRYLNRLAYQGPGRKQWARHGSTRWLWKDKDVLEAMRYVVEGQGEPMALFVSELVE